MSIHGKIIPMRSFVMDLSTLEIILLLKVMGYGVVELKSIRQRLKTKKFRAEKDILNLNFKSRRLKLRNRGGVNIKN